MHLIRNIFALGLGVYLVHRFRGKDKPDPTRPDTLYDEQDFIAAVKNLGQEFNKNELIGLEKTYRLETNNFKSGQYKLTGSPGMIAASDAYPWGWSSLKNVPNFKKTTIAPIFVKTSAGEKINRYIPYIRFPSVYDAARCFLLFMKDRRPGRWNSKDAAGQLAYEAVLNKFSSPIVNKLFA